MIKSLIKAYFYIYFLKYEQKCNRAEKPLVLYMCVCACVTLLI